MPVNQIHVCRLTSLHVAADMEPDPCLETPCPPQQSLRLSHGGSLETLCGGSLETPCLSRLHVRPSSPSNPCLPPQQPVARST